MKSENSIHVLTVDDHDLVRKGLAAILALETDIELVAEAADSVQAIEAYRRHTPDVTLMDLRLPGRGGIETTRAIRSEFPGAKVVALTSYGGDQDVYRALDAGVRGYLLKEMLYSEIVRAIRVVHAGKRFMPAEVSDTLGGFFPEIALTAREVDVLMLVARGFSNKEAGAVLGTAPGTIKAQVQSILAKLGAKDRTHAVTIGLERGIIHLHDAPRAATRA